MSRRFASNFSSSAQDSAKKIDITTPNTSRGGNTLDNFELDSNARSFDAPDVNARNTTPVIRVEINFDANDLASSKNMDFTSATKRGELVDGIKKTETPEHTAKFGDTVTNSSFYKKNKGKLLAMGLTGSAVAGWFGVLLAQGHSPADAWDIMEETTSNWMEGASKTGGNLMKQFFLMAWNAVVVFVHESVGHLVFEEKDQTGKALVFLLISGAVNKISSVFGINLFRLSFGMLRALVRSILYSVFYFVGLKKKGNKVSL